MHRGTIPCLKNVIPLELCRLSEAITLHVSVAQGFTPLPKGCRPFGTSGVSAIALCVINPLICDLQRRTAIRLHTSIIPHPSYITKVCTHTSP